MTTYCVSSLNCVPYCKIHTYLKCLHGCLPLPLCRSLQWLIILSINKFSQIFDLNLLWYNPRLFPFALECFCLRKEINTLLAALPSSSCIGSKWAINGQYMLFGERGCMHIFYFRFILFRLSFLLKRTLSCSVMTLQWRCDYWINLKESLCFFSLVLCISESHFFL